MKNIKGFLGLVMAGCLLLFAETAVASSCDKFKMAVYLTPNSSNLQLNQIYADGTGTGKPPPSGG